MGLFGGQFSSVVEWKEYSDDIIFWKFPSSEIKKGSRLIIRPGQDAIFMYNGRIEGIFREEGNFDISSDIIPFLSTLKHTAACRGAVYQYKGIYSKMGHKKCD